MSEWAAIVPEDRDWTGVIDDGCAECGFVPQRADATGGRLRATVPVWREVLSRSDATRRPAPTVWSPVEYACHVRDTCRIFRGRLALMLDEDDPVFPNWDQDATAVEDDPVFPNWDQDATAVEDDYFHQSPARVAGELAEQAESTAAAFDAVTPEQWARPGRRSNGSVFTVRRFAVYFLHDVVHHVHDVTRPTTTR